LIAALHREKSLDSSVELFPEVFLKLVLKSVEFVRCSLLYRHLPRSEQPHLSLTSVFWLNPTLKGDGESQRQAGLTRFRLLWW
jgi:hypothetical protein